MTLEEAQEQLEAFKKENARLKGELEGPDDRFICRTNRVPTAADKQRWAEKNRRQAGSPATPEQNKLLGILAQIQNLKAEQAKLKRG